MLTDDGLLPNSCAGILRGITDWSFDIGRHKRYLAADDDDGVGVIANFRSPKFCITYYRI